MQKRKKTFYAFSVVCCTVVVSVIAVSVQSPLQSLFQFISLRYFRFWFFLVVFCLLYGSVVGRFFFLILVHRNLVQNCHLTWKDAAWNVITENWGFLFLLHIVIQVLTLNVFEFSLKCDPKNLKLICTLQKKKILKILFHTTFIIVNIPIIKIISSKINSSPNSRRFLKAKTNTLILKLKFQN